MLNMVNLKRINNGWIVTKNERHDCIVSINLCEI
jgi:hypothetical protein